MIEADFYKIANRDIWSRTMWRTTSSFIDFKCCNLNAHVVGA